MTKGVHPAADTQTRRQMRSKSTSTESAPVSPYSAGAISRLPAMMLPHGVECFIQVASDGPAAEPHNGEGPWRAVAVHGHTRGRDGDAHDLIRMLVEPLPECGVFRSRDGGADIPDGVLHRHTTVALRLAGLIVGGSAGGVVLD